MPKTYFELPPDQGKTKLYVTWRDKRGEQADIFPINFDPLVALAESDKKILDELWTAWVAFRDCKAETRLFQQLITYRCAIKEVRYGLDDAAGRQSVQAAALRLRDPYRDPENSVVDIKVPTKTLGMRCNSLISMGRNRRCARSIRRRTTISLVIPR